jgi:hypothetical protein
MIIEQVHPSGADALEAETVDALLVAAWCGRNVEPFIVYMRQRWPT